MKLNLEAILTFIFAVAFWELASHLELIPQYLFPSPTQVLESLYLNRSEFFTAFAQTLKGTVSGFLLSLILGTLIAMVFSLSAFLRKAILPFAVFFQTVPIIAVAPLLVIYFGFGLPTVIAASFIVSFFPIVANSLLGLESADPGAMDLFKLYGATSTEVLLKLKLPASYPLMYAGWKVSIGLAIIGTVAGEFVAGGGLGAMIDAARTQQRIDLVFAALALLTVLGIGLMCTLRLSHFLLQKYRPYGLHLKE